jgi:hypothetical protein
MQLYLGGAQRAVQKKTVLHGVFSVPGMFCAILARLPNFAVEKLAAARALVTPTDQRGDLLAISLGECRIWAFPFCTPAVQKLWITG